MKTATLRVIESNYDYFYNGQEMVGAIPCPPEVDKEFFMYTGEGENYLYIQNVNDIRYVDGEIIVYGECGVFSLTIHEDAAPRGFLYCKHPESL